MFRVSPAASITAQVLNTETGMPRAPQKAKELKVAFDRWLEQMADPITGGSKRAPVKATRKKKRKSP